MLFLLVSSHGLMQSLWTVWEQPSGWRCSGSTCFWQIGHSLRASTAAAAGAGEALCAGWATVPDPSFFASLSPTCTTTSSMDIPASVPRELFTCWSSDVSWALVHSGKRLPSLSSNLSSLSCFPAAEVVLGGGVEGPAGLLS